MKKLISISIVFIMTMLLLSSISYGELASDTTGSIKVLNIESGLKVTLYKLTNVNIKNGQPVEPAYEWDTEVQQWIDENYVQFSDPEDFYNEYSTDIENETDLTNTDLAEFYSKLASNIKGGSISVTTSVEKVADSDDAVTFSDLKMGTYLIIVENGNYVYRATATNLVPTFGDDGEWNLTTPVTVEMKRSSVGIEKTVNDVRVSTADTISYTITTDVPSYSGISSAPTYTIIDELANGLILDEASIVVKGIKGTSQPTLTAETDYKITKYDSSGNVITDTTTQVAKFEIAFKNVSTYDYKKIQITYNCKLSLDSKTSIIGVNDAKTGNVNKATLTYSKNTYDPVTTATTDSSTTVYTYGIQVEKQDMDTKEKLPNAEFTLKDENGALLYFVGSNGIYYLANEDDEGSDTKVIGNSSGMLYLYGLDIGTYTLEETKAPAGYILPSDTFSIEIADAVTNGKIEKEGAEQTNGVYSTTIPNRHGFQLPITGGIGTIVFAAAGIVLVGLGIVFLVVVFKKRKLVK